VSRKIWQPWPGHPVAAFFFAFTFSINFRFAATFSSFDRFAFKEMDRVPSGRFESAEMGVKENKNKRNWDWVGHENFGLGPGRAQALYFGLGLLGATELI
jgi:hypothetical protein